MSNNLYPCVTIPGQTKIHPYFQLVQDNTISWAQRFDLTPQFKPVSWYVKARFGLQAAREYPHANLDYINLAGDLLTWLFTVDDTCDRASSDQPAAEMMKIQIEEFHSILKGEQSNSLGSLSVALENILTRFKEISSPFLYRQYCRHMTDYLKECTFEIQMQLEGYIPSIKKYFQERPFTGFYIMFPLVAIFEGLDVPDEVYEHNTIRELELDLNLLGCLSNDLHSISRERKLDKTGFNLILIAQQELNLSLSQAVSYVVSEHANHLRKFEKNRDILPDWGSKINQQVERYVEGLKTIVRGYDDWAVIDTGRYE